MRVRRPHPEFGHGIVRWGRAACVLLALLCGATSGCTSHPREAAHAARDSGTPPSPSQATTGPAPRPAHRLLPPSVAAPFRDPLPGMPAALGNDVYGATRAGMLSAAVAHDPAYLYVPDATGATVTVISQRTHRIVRVLRTGQLSQHVTPSYDLRRLYTDASAANELVGVDPGNARVVSRTSVPRPYNLYFTPDGKQAVIMVEQHDKVRFADPRTFRPRDEVAVRGCRGPNHADFSANGRYLVITCEFSGAAIKLSTVTHRVLGMVRFGRGSMPQDIRISPDGQIFYVADMGRNVVRLINGDTLRQVGELAMPTQPHGLYPSRNGRLLYVSDRGAGKVSVISFATRRIVSTWGIPHGGSPDMGGVSADGSTLWLTGRYSSEVYGIDTATGRLAARIHVGGSPHGMAVWPQPGRYSLGHTGNMR